MIYGTEACSEWGAASQEQAQRLGFERMQFLNLSVARSAEVRRFASLIICALITVLVEDRSESWLGECR